MTPSTNCLPIEYDRGPGTTAGCSSSEEQSGALCYPKCASGYKRVAGVCWQTCPSGYRDDGVFCFKPGNYARDKYPWKLGDTVGSLDDARARCRKAHPNVGCEKQGQIIYENCKSGWREIGLDWCGRSCPSGMKDIGISCAKGNIDTSLKGTPLHSCPQGKENYKSLCYTECIDGYKGTYTQCKRQ